MTMNKVVYKPHIAKKLDSLCYIFVADSIASVNLAQLAPKAAVLY